MIEQIRAIGINKFYDYYSKLIIITFTIRTKDQPPETPSTRLTYYVDSKEWAGDFVKFNNPDVPIDDFDIERIVFVYDLENRVAEILKEEGL
jgi:hypothetical protein